MRVLILGLSSIVQRRVLPALAVLDAVHGIDIASQGKSAPEGLVKFGNFYSSYDEALAGSPADLVYVSLPNSQHYHWILAALNAGKHVVVDKPAVPTLAQTRECLAAASRNGRLLAEATVFSCHPQIAAMAGFFGDQGPLTHIHAQFIIPPLPAANFRNHAASGGGCLQDMGPYAAATARLFAHSPLRELYAVPAPGSPRLDIDTGFSLLAGFEDGLRYTGHFSFESEYQNRLTLVGARGSLVADRVFSPPGDQPAIWQVRRENRTGEESYPASDVFAVFLAEIAAAVARREFGSFAQDMLRDAQFREAVSTSLASGNRGS